MEENIAEDKLLVDVPGSSYSGGGITKSAGSEDLNSSKAR